MPRRYSGFFGSICTNLAWTGLAMATGSLRGPDPLEMAKSDCVVIWGTNAVSTQVNVMTHAIKARKDRGAKIVVIDIYDNPTVKQADMGLVLKPRHGCGPCLRRHAYRFFATAMPTVPISPDMPMIRRGWRST